MNNHWLKPDGTPWGKPWCKLVSRRFRDHVRSPNNNPDGRIIRMPCHFHNGWDGEAHHPDYSRTWAVAWLCIPCHRRADHDSLQITETMIWDYSSLIIQRPGGQKSNPLLAAVSDVETIAGITNPSVVFSESDRNRIASRFRNHIRTARSNPRGRVIRMPCHFHPEYVAAQAFHFDWSRPWAVMWLCPRCIADIRHNGMPRDVKKMIWDYSSLIIQRPGAYKYGPAETRQKETASCEEVPF